MTPVEKGTPTPELKPCPFCVQEDSDPVLVNGGPGNFFVMCNGCNCETDDGTQERVIKLWNDRASIAGETT